MSAVWIVFICQLISSSNSRGTGTANKKSNICVRNNVYTAIPAIKRPLDKQNSNQRNHQRSQKLNAKTKQINTEHKNQKPHRGNSINDFSASESDNNKLTQKDGNKHKGNGINDARSKGAGANTKRLARNQAANTSRKGKGNMINSMAFKQIEDIIVPKSTYVLEHAVNPKECKNNGNINSAGMKTKINTKYTNLEEIKEPQAEAYAVERHKDGYITIVPRTTQNDNSNKSKSKGSKKQDKASQNLKNRFSEEEVTRFIRARTPNN